MNVEEFRNLPQANKNKLLLTSVIDSNIENIKLALEEGANVNYTTPQGYTSLYESVGTGNEQIVNILLEAGANIDVPGDKYNGPPLVWAADKGDINIVKILVEKGGNINIKHEKDNGDTPLHIASKTKRDNIILFLVENGADLTIQNDFGRTPTDIIVKEYVEPFDKKITSLEKNIKAQEKEKEKILKKMEDPANEGILKRLESELKTYQTNIDRQTPYLQEYIDNKERGIKLIQPIIEKAMEQKVPLKNVSVKPIVKELYEKIVKGRVTAAMSLKRGVQDTLNEDTEKNIRGFLWNGGKQKKGKTRKSKKTKKTSKKTTTRKSNKTKQT